MGASQLMDTEFATEQQQSNRQPTSYETASESARHLIEDFGPVGASQSWSISFVHGSGAPRTSPVRWRSYVTERFRQLADHVDDSGYPSLETLNRALRSIDSLLSTSTPTPSMLPSDECGVELLWQKNGWDVQVELDENGEDFFWARERASGEVISGDLTELRPVFRDVLAHLAAE